MSRPSVEVVPVKKVYLGEGPHWDVKRQQLYYVDLFGKSVHRYDPKTGEEFELKIAEKGQGMDAVSLVVPVESQPDKFIIGLGRSLRTVEWDGKSSTPKSLKTIHVLEDGNSTGRFNDGKCDSDGRLWAGTMGYYSKGRLDEKKGILYKLNKEGALTQHLNKIDISNGLAWSTDNRTFYYVDTLAHSIDAFDYNQVEGTISNRRTAFDFKTNHVAGDPDGMCIDANGNLWLAVFNGDKVLHIDPNVGKLIDQVNFPTSNITSVTFGGPNLDILYATSAQHDLTREQISAQPSAGALFQITNTGCRGYSGGVSFAGQL